MAVKITSWTPQALLREVDLKENTILNSMADYTEAQAKDLCPVKTGELQDSIRQEVDTNEKISYVGSDLDYSIYVEYGTRHMQAQPYLRPAFDLTEQNADMIIDSVVQVD